MPNSLRCKIKHLYHNGTLTERERDRILKALELIPDNATNGDVICALWNVSVVYEKGCYRIIRGGERWSSILKFSEEWWNAPYKAESEVEECH